MLVAEAGARKACLVDEQALGLERGDLELHRAPVAELHPASDPSASSPSTSARSICSFQSGQRRGSAHSAQISRGIGADAVAVDGFEHAQVGSGEPAKAKNQIIIAIEATMAVPTKTASTGLSLLVPGR